MNLPAAVEADIMFTRIARSFLMLCITATIAIVSANAAKPGIAPELAQHADWQPLFNGKDLSGWHVVLSAKHRGVDPDKVFQVHDGVIHVYQDVPQGAPVPVGFLASDDRYSWYELKLEFRWIGKRFAPRVARPRDAGALYHASDEQKVWPRCFELQIQEGDVGDCYLVNGIQVTSTVDPTKLRSDVHQFLPAAEGGVSEVRGGPNNPRIVKSSTHEVEGWNTVNVIVRGGDEVIHKINGDEVFHATNLKQLASDPSGVTSAANMQPDASQRKWIPLTSGRVLLQAEYAELQYRNVQIRPLPGGPFKADDPAPATHAKK
jgi:hypothetical protein